MSERLAADVVTRTCARCGASAEQVRIGVLVSEPQGWTYITVGGLPICNRQLCPTCATDVRAYLTISPNDLAALRDVERTEDFRRGYEDGCDDTERATHVCVCAPSEAS